MSTVWKNLQKINKKVSTTKVQKYVETEREFYFKLILNLKQNDTRKKSKSRVKIQKHERG